MSGASGVGRGGAELEAGSTGLGDGGTDAGRGGQGGTTLAGGAGGSAELGCTTVWGKNCLTTCVDTGEPESGGAGAGGQNGAAGAGEGGACHGPAPGCCNTDADCPRAFECVPATDAPHGGVCKERLADRSQCWRDAECPTGYHCDGVLLHACGDGAQDESRGDCRPD